MKQCFAESKRGITEFKLLPLGVFYFKRRKIEFWDFRIFNPVSNSAIEPFSPFLKELCSSFIIISNGLSVIHFDKLRAESWEI
jgi:hypothetical protein